MSDTSTIEQVEQKVFLQEPTLYRVLILNDDYTTVDFVVEILLTIFEKTYQQAVELTHKVHHDGAGLCGVYTYDIAQTKIKLAHKEARKQGFPLKLIYEQA